MRMDMGTGVRVQHMYLDTPKKLQRRTQKVPISIILLKINRERHRENLVLSTFYAYLNLPKNSQISLLLTPNPLQTIDISRFPTSTPYYHKTTQRLYLNKQHHKTPPNIVMSTLHSFLNTKIRVTPRQLTIAISLFKFIIV